MRVKHGAWVASMAVLILGCQTQVSGGSSGVGGAGATTTTSTGDATTGGIEPKGSVNLAMLYSESPNKNDPGWAAATSSGGKPFDPDSLVVFLNSLTLVCTNPYAFGEACDTESLVTILLPPALQAVGTYSLSQLAAVGISSECGRQFSSYWDGTIEITAISATSVTFKLAGTSTPIVAGQSGDGTYTVERCF
ncbi:MAG: hypothetical protein ABJE95_11170 [Byssovorax sp.]